MSCSLNSFRRVNRGLYKGDHYMGYSGGILGVWTIARMKVVRCFVAWLRVLYRLQTFGFTASRVQGSGIIVVERRG